MEPEPGWRHGEASRAGDHGKSGEHSGISNSHHETSVAEEHGGAGGIKSRSRAGNHHTETDRPGDHIEAGDHQDGLEDH